MWTGKLYGFYTEINIEDVFKRIKKYTNRMGYNFEYSRYEDEENLFFYKNQKMYNHHLERGYNTDVGGEGCFSIEAKNTTIDGIATLIKFEGCSNFDPFNINLVFNNVFYYILVVPYPIKDSSFSKKIYDIFHDILLKKEFTGQN